MSYETALLNFHCILLKILYVIILGSCKHFVIILGNNLFINELGESMTDFITAINGVLEEQGKTTQDLFDDDVISKDTFYKYKRRNPSLTTLIKIANYLQVSIDYIYELTDNNDFRQYSSDQNGFYQKLIKLINSAGLSNRQFCKNLHYTKDAILRYKNGTTPSIMTLIEIAQYFNCTVDDLLTHQ